MVQVKELKEFKSRVDGIISSGLSDSSLSASIELKEAYDKFWKICQEFNSKFRNMDDAATINEVFMLGVKEYAKRVQENIEAQIYMDANKHFMDELEDLGSNGAWKDTDEDEEFDLGDGGL